MSNKYTPGTIISTTEKNLSNQLLPYEYLLLNKTRKTKYNTPMWNTICLSTYKEYELSEFFMNKHAQIVYLCPEEPGEITSEETNG